MDDQNKSDFSDTMETGASAASTVQGVIKTGKAVASIAKGTAAGGPYGAVAGALWTNRKTVVKIVVATAFFLLLPILFILMLPGLIFGSLTNGFSPNSPAVPILNDSTAIVENANNISFSINSILSEGLEDVLIRIDADFAASDGDFKEVINPYSGNLMSNINLFISQYCASKNNDFASISLSNMEYTLRCGEAHLYSFTKDVEYRDRTGTSEEITITEKWIIYTIVYNGEAYFADHIFRLNDEQKALSLDYAQNLSLFLGDGMFQGLPADCTTLPSLGNIHFTDGMTEVVYFNQLDESYASKPYGTDNIGSYGCGPTAMSIVVSSMTNKTVNPEQMAKWAYDNGYWCKGSGSYHALIPSAAKAWNLPVDGCTVAEPQKIIDALSDGKLVVAIMSKGHFTSGGHFIVLRGTKDGKILVADPASYNRSQQEWDLSIIISEASKRAAAGGPFWIIG
ncbi:C39 family peptidase [Anaerotignum sp.]|uniref:C39 family peptidase n=1 Tax=Anaerotignum sp. TaxID=2039241 RepID=UPI0028A8752D|nr:C39 family peptidase [Anaerotignum sp.]